LKLRFFPGIANPRDSKQNNLYSLFESKSKNEFTDFSQNLSAKHFFAFDFLFLNWTIFHERVYICQFDKFLGQEIASFQSNLLKLHSLNSDFNVGSN